MTSLRLGSGEGRFGRRAKAVPYVAAALSLVAGVVHLIAIPGHFEEWWGYGAFFLVAALFQGAYGAALLRWPRPSLLNLGIAANLGVIVLWLVTRTAGVPLFGPHAGEVEDVGALDLAATATELALVLVLLARLWLSWRPGTVLSAGASTSRWAVRGGERSLVAVLAAAVVVLSGVAVWLWLSGRPPGNSSAEVGFARDMSVHHAQAVEMAEIVRDKTESEEIRIMAADIALTQQAQIGQMQGWLDAWGLPPTGSGPAMAWMGHPTEGRMPGMASPQEVNRLRELPPHEVDELFLRLLVEHHRAAIPMAEAVLDETDNPAVEELAGAIVASQRAEIETMQSMLEDMGAPPVEEREPMQMDGGGGHAGGNHGE